MSLEHTEMNENCVCENAHIQGFVTFLPLTLLTRLVRYNTPESMSPDNGLKHQYANSNIYIQQVIGI